MQSTQRIYYLEFNHEREAETHTDRHAVVTAAREYCQKYQPLAEVEVRQFRNCIEYSFDGLIATIHTFTPARSDHRQADIDPREKDIVRESIDTVWRSTFFYFDDQPFGELLDTEHAASIAQAASDAVESMLIKLFER